MTDERMDSTIAKLLRIGVASAAALVLAGGLAYVAAGSRSVPDYRHFQPQMRGLGAIRSLHWPEALIEIGLLVLIATPVARVVFSLVAFAAGHDRMYVWFTAAVLAVLLYSVCTALL